MFKKNMSSCISCDYIVPKHATNVAIMGALETSRMPSHAFGIEYINGPASETSLGTITGEIMLLGGIATLHMDQAVVTGTYTDQFVGSTFNPPLPDAYKPCTTNVGAGSEKVWVLAGRIALKMTNSGISLVEAPSGDYLPDETRIETISMVTLPYLTAAEQALV